MDITRLVPDLPVVLTDWFDGSGYNTVHISLGTGTGTGVCGRGGLPYTYYSALLSPEDELMCAGCVNTIQELLNDGYGVEDL